MERKGKEKKRALKFIKEKGTMMRDQNWKRGKGKKRWKGKEEEKVAIGKNIKSLGSQNK